MKTPFIPKLAILIVLFISISALCANTAVIEKVLSGDRLQIQGWEVVRLTGIKAPAMDEPMGKEAFEFANKELQGKKVIIVTYTTNNTAAGIVRDADSLAMVQVIYGDVGNEKKAKSETEKPRQIDFNAMLLQKGLARVDEEYLPESMSHYRKLQTIAQKEKAGLWKKTKKK